MTTTNRGLAQAAAIGLAAMALGMAVPAFAAAPVPNKGDTAWMLISSALVLLMTVPGLALFYGGLVRTKNMLSMLMQVFAIVCIVSLIYVVYGYSMSFTGNGSGSLNPFTGGLTKAFLKGVTPDSNVPTFSNGVVIPEYVYIAFQMTFACITPALIVGAFAERMKFSALIVFTVLWVTIVYFPVAHMVWYIPAPDAIAEAAKKLAEASGDEAKKVAQAALDAVTNDAGYLASTRGSPVSSAP
jgi:ammonium transporter, Amt family